MNALSGFGGRRGYCPERKESVLAPDEAKRRISLIVMGLPEGAGREEVRKRYIELSKGHHPDSVGEEDGRYFSLVATAYGVLSGEIHANEEVADDLSDYDLVCSFLDPSERRRFDDVYGKAEFSWTEYMKKRFPERPEGRELLDE